MIYSKLNINTCPLCGKLLLLELKNEDTTEYICPTSFYRDNIKYAFTHFSLSLKSNQDIYVGFEIKNPTSDKIYLNFDYEEQSLRYELLSDKFAPFKINLDHYPSLKTIDLNQIVKSIEEHLLFT